MLLKHNESGLTVFCCGSDAEFLHCGSYRKRAALSKKGKVKLFLHHSGYPPVSICCEKL